MVRCSRAVGSHSRHRAQGTSLKAAVCRTVGRQLEKERGAVPFVAVLANRAAVGFDDAVTHRQAEAGALPDRLPREERLEQLRFVLPRHAPPDVIDLNATPASAV